MVALIDMLDEKIKELDRELRKIYERTPEIRLLTTIPGVGIYAACLIFAEIGDVRRFTSAEKLCAYAGLVPSTHQSGTRVKHGPITKEGSKYLRWILTECTKVHVARFDTNLTEFYRRVAKRRGKQKAIIVAARKLTKIIYWMLINNECFKSWRETSVRSTAGKPRGSD
ncbi:MAG: hypothetical protein DRN20_00920 [Thermoplasmata archaeon]|nr:MAG: hypothetical protein DRN20_00920 [Thermoplasmata archaeon]